MEKRVTEHNTEIIHAGVLVIGSGTASLKAAVELKRGGADVIVVTEHPRWGTGANTGSDRQTYYRAAPGVPGGDSFSKMADTLYSGGAMHGDIALIEASLSLKSFYYLSGIGVPFPHDTAGRYTSYRTDHDTERRGSSAGPRTSIMMHQSLSREAHLLGIPFFDHHEVIELVVEKGRCTGVIAIDRQRVEEKSRGLMIFAAPFTVLGTGGPGALFGRSVYPFQQKGSLGLALKAGATFQNLTESQFGIGSVRFRWNLSGSYQQVLPRYWSRDDAGKKYFFLDDYFTDAASMHLAQFQKGYMWPFDVKKCLDEGPSLIDLLVYRETVIKKRRVFLDFRENPAWRNHQFSLNELPPEVFAYLEKSTALQETPFRRLMAMNPDAVELYRGQGIDLSRDPLEAAVNHQHCNGGIAADIWWESDIENLFPVGECCGTHGIYRPGGSALNAGQAGALRASEQILYRVKKGGAWGEVKGEETHLHYEHSWRERISRLLSLPEKNDPLRERRIIRCRADRALGILRGREEIEKAFEENIQQQVRCRDEGISSPRELLYYLKNEDLLLTERAMLEAARETFEKVTGGRGSWFAAGEDDLFRENLKDATALELPDTSHDNAGEILTSHCDHKGNFIHRWVPVRPVPDGDGWFEDVWRRYRSGEIFETGEM